MKQTILRIALVILAGSSVACETDAQKQRKIMRILKVEAIILEALEVRTARFEGVKVKRLYICGSVESVGDYRHFLVDRYDSNPDIYWTEGQNCQ